MNQPVKYKDNRISEVDSKKVLGILAGGDQFTFTDIERNTTFSKNRLRKILTFLQDEGKITQERPDPYKPAQYAIRNTVVNPFLLRMDLIPLILEIAAAHSSITAQQTVKVLKVHHKQLVDVDQIRTTLEYLAREKQLQMRQVGSMMLYSQLASNRKPVEAEAPLKPQTKALNPKSITVERKTRFSEVQAILFA